MEVMSTAKAVLRPLIQGSGVVDAAAPEPLHGDAEALDQRSEQAFRPARHQVLSRRRQVFLAVKFLARYALLAIAAYAMLTCFRLHPVGLAAGVTSPVLAAAWQAGRMLRATARRRRR